MCDTNGMRRMCTFAGTGDDDCEMREGDCDLDTLRYDTIRYNMMNE